MKTLILLITSIVLLSCNPQKVNLTISPGLSKNHNMCYILDVPEEYEQISNYSHKPDTLISWISGDTIHFRFLIAARHFPEANH